MGSIVLREEDSDNIKEAEIGLSELLSHLEHMCPELKQEQLDAEKIDYLVQQYSSNLMN